MIIQPYDMCLILWTVLKKSLCAEKCNDIKALKLWGYNNNGFFFAIGFLSEKEGYQTLIFW